MSRLVQTAQFAGTLLWLSTRVAIPHINSPPAPRATAPIQYFRPAKTQVYYLVNMLCHLKPLT